MKKELMMCTLALAVTANASSKPKTPSAATSLRAPAVPLITSDPYLSIWSNTDNLYDGNTIHWTGKNHPLVGAIRVDGKTYRFMGLDVASYTQILPPASHKKWDAAYTEKQPSEGWTGVNFNDNAWIKGKGDFSTDDRSGFATRWESKDIWIRRSFELKEDISTKNLFIEYSHDDIFELYINGVKVVETGYSWRDNVFLELDAATKKLLKPGKNVIAAHCHNRTGGGYVDFGLMSKDDTGVNFTDKAVQLSATVMATQTIYKFACGPVQLNLTFTAPLLMDDLDLVSTPINYISYEVVATDKKSHDVQIYIETTPQLAVNRDSQPVGFEKISKNNYTYLKTGTINQPMLGQTGDDMRIDWGYLYLGGHLKPQEQLTFGGYFDVKKAFISTGKLPADVNPRTLPSNMLEKMTVLAYCNNLGPVSKDTPAKGRLMLGYDDINSIRYFYKDLPAYWKHNGKVDITQAFEKADKSYESLMTRCARFDQQLMADAEKAGGKQYAEICALAYRQAITAHKLVQDDDGNLLFLSKENNSNGCINTVDVTYPSAPLFLIYNPDLLKGMLTPIFHYSESGRWTKPFPAHDLGQYPIANGQVYGGDMPVEEAGNMLILTAAISFVEGNTAYAAKHWDVMTVWADYLLKEGLDPENQLCTDDFAGHSAHNTNLSIKAIMGIAGYGKMAEMMGNKAVAEKYVSAAKEMATKWASMAADGDHYRLTFDKPGTWSQKYNLVWDLVFDLGIFAPEVAQKEMAYYQTKQNTYGLPLDSRKTYTKSDWIVWTASMAQTPAQFDQLIAPLYKYVNETSTRVPLSDWHETVDGSSVGFKARSVVGGYYMRMLDAKVKAGKK